MSRPPTCPDTLGDLTQELEGIIDAILVRHLAALGECIHHCAVKAQHIERLLAQDGHQLARIRPVDLRHWHVDAPDDLRDIQDQEYSCKMVKRCAGV